ncbi:MAG: HEPN domain-containing protein [Bacteroidota bacterium]|nr:DNA-binding protein [Odoribacter sp.]MDP3641904.1 HEPN domain-containing protein [Bacteroidota bacterium]
MEEEIRNIDSIINHWRESSEQNYASMQNLIKTKEYSWALFLGHLVIEKLLKALYVKRLQKHPAFSHDLLRLAKKIDVELPEGYDEWLDEITTFNINARYDGYKQNFQKLCTVDFSNEWISKIETLRQWLINQL